MKKSVISSALTFLFATTFSCNSSGVQSCRIKEIRTLFMMPWVDVGEGEVVDEVKITGYSHGTLIKDITRDCLDSTMLVGAATRYRDTIKVGNPVNAIMILNYDKDFIPIDTSRVLDDKEIDKRCLVVIGFDEKTRKPNDFIFYNEQGKIVYSGDRWLPKGM